MSIRFCEQNKTFYLAGKEYSYIFRVNNEGYLEHLYYENGLLYITKKELLLQEMIIGPAAYPLLVDHPYGEIDIDTERDMHYAEYRDTSKDIF